MNAWKRYCMSLALSVFVLTSSSTQQPVYAQCNQTPEASEGCQEGGQIGGPFAWVAAGGVAIGVAVWYGIKTGFFADVGDAFVDFLGSLNPFGDDEEDSSGPPPPNPAETIKQVGTDAGVQVGRASEVSPVSSPSDVPSPRSSQVLGSARPPVDQGTATNQPGPNSVAIPAADPGSERAATDPVSLHRGEFVYSAVDHEINGEEPTLSFVRTYRSRVDFSGSLGPAWGHNFDVRVYTDTNPNVCQDEITLSLGSLQSVPMRPDSSSFGEIAYRPLAAGINHVLYRHPANETNNECIWELVLPTAQHYCFDSNGLARALIWPNGNRLDVTWEGFSDDELDDYHVTRVRRVLGGRATHDLNFTYDSDHPRLLKATTLSLSSRPPVIVNYDYNSAGQLWQVRGPELRATYGYADTSGLNLDEKVPLEGLGEYCGALCAPERAVGCGVTESFCRQAAASAVSSCPTVCNSRCEQACAGTYEAHRAEIIDVCVNGNEADRAACTQGFETSKQYFQPACVAACKPECQAECSDVNQLTDSCEGGCFSSCMGLASDRSVFVYGQTADLLNNLETVVDGEGRRIVYNQYGLDPSLPSFDAVLEQQQGEGQPSVSFGYGDLKPPGSEIYAKPGEASFPQVVSARAARDPSWTGRLRDNAPNGTLRMCETSQSRIPTELTFAPILGRLLVSMPTLDTLPKLAGREVVLARAQADGSLQVRGAPSAPSVSTHLTVGGLRTNATLSGGVLSLSSPSESVRLSARRVAAPASPTAGAIESVRDVALYASNTLTINDRVKVLNGAGGWAKSANVGTGTLTVGSQAQVGTLQSKGPTWLRDRAQVNGDVESVGPLTRQNLTVVSGQILSSTSLVGSPIDLSVTFPATTLGNVSVEPDQQRALSAGAYGSLNLKSRTKLFLTSGAYYFTSAAIEPDAQVVLSTASGPVYVYVKTTFTFNGSIVSDRTTHDGLFVGILGTASIPIQRSFSGTIVAPNASLVLASVGQAGHNGSFFAKSIEVHQDAVVRLYPFGKAWTGPPLPTSGVFDAARTFSAPTAVRLPAEALVRKGQSGSGALTLTFTGGTCRYVAGLGVPSNQPDARINAPFFKLQSCSTGARAGDVITTSLLGLRVETGARPNEKGEVEIEMRLPVANQAGTAGSRFLQAAGAVAGDFVAMAADPRGYEVLGVITGAVSLTRGTCNDTFKLRQTSEPGTAQIEPASACESSVRMVPISELKSSFRDTWAALADGAPILDLDAYGRLSPLDRIARPVTSQSTVLQEWSRALAALDSAGTVILNPPSGTAPVLGPTSPTSLVSAELLLSRVEKVAQYRPSDVKQQIAQKVAEIRLGSVLGDLDRLRQIEVRPVGTDIAFHPALDPGWVADLRDLFTLTAIDVSRLDPLFNVFGPACEASKAYLAPSQASKVRDRGRARWATRVFGPDRETLISYYSKEGNNLRNVNLTRGVVDDFEYDANHRRIGAFKHAAGSLTPLEPRTCSTVDDRGLTTTVSRISLTGTALTQCLRYDDDGPWMTRASHPGAPTNLLVSRAYDDAGRLLTSANDGAEVTAYTYSGGRLETTTEPNGTISRYLDYDFDVGLPREIRLDSQGAARTTRLSYDLFGHVATLDRPGWGPNERFSWLDHTRLDFHETQTEEGTDREDYSYNGAGQVETISSRTLTRDFSYDSAGALSRVQETSDGKSRTTCYKHRSDGTVSEMVDPNGAKFTAAYQYAGTERTTDVSLSENTDPQCARSLEPEGAPPAGILSSVRIDGADRVVRTDDSARFRTDYAYDSLGRAFSTGRGSSSQRFTTARYYDELDRVVAELDVEGNVTPPAAITESTAALNSVSGAIRARFHRFDRAGRPSRTTEYVRHPARNFEKAADTETTFEVSARRIVSTAHTVAGDLVRTVQLDGMGRPVSDTDTAGNSTTFTYPNFVTEDSTVRGPEGTDIAIHREFTLRGALKTMLVGGREVLANTYDVFGRVTQSRDEAKQTSISYEAFDQPAQVDRASIADPGNSLEFESFQYDERGRRKEVFAGARRVSTFGYDLLGRITRETRPSSVEGGPATRDWLTTYRHASTLPDVLTLPSKRAISYSYLSDRPIVTFVRADASQTPDVVGTKILAAALDRTPAGFLKQARVLDGPFVPSVVDRTVDGAGRVITEAMSARGHAMERSYGLGVGLTSLTNNGQAFSYVRAPDNRLKEIRQGTTRLVGLSYQGAGPPKSITYGANATETRSYDARGRLVNQDLGAPLSLTYGYGADGMTRRFTASEGSSPLSWLTKHDGVGRVSTELRRVSGSVDSLVSGSITNSDVDDFASSAADARVYDLDTSNNWTQVSTLTQPLFTPAPDEANAYGTTLYGAASYDADGRLVSAGNRQYKYDAFGNLVRVTAPDLDCAYAYDALGRRIEETCNQVTVRFGHDGLAMVAEQRNNQTYRTLHADGLDAPIVRIAPNATEFLIAGKDRSIHAVLNSAGQVIQRQRYTAFGETSIIVPTGATSSGNRFAYQGHLYDPGPGLYQMRARVYAPVMGRFLTPDPVGARGGANFFAFAENRPTDLSDPFGLTPQSNPLAEHYRQLPPEPCIGDCHTRDGRFRPIQHGPNYVAAMRDALNSPDPETRAQAALTLGSMGMSAVPYVGDYGSAFLSVVNFGAFPSWANFVDACLDCAGAALPAVGPSGSIRRIERLGNVGEDLVGAGEDIQRFAREAGGGVELFHGTTGAGAESILNEGLLPVSRHTAPFPAGSFFTHVGGDGSVAASHWAARSASLYGGRPVLLRGTMSVELFDDLSARGLVKTGPVPGLPFFPPQTVILPEGLGAASSGIQWSVVPLEF